MFWVKILILEYFKQFQIKIETISYKVKESDKNLWFDNILNKIFKHFGQRFSDKIGVSKYLR